MEKKDSSIIKFSSDELKDINSFCKLNELDYFKFVKECFNKGYQIEKYGLLTIDGQSVIEKEVIKEVEKIVEVIKEVEVEKIVEVIKEVEVEVEVEKIVEVVKEIEKPVEVIKEVEKIVEVIKEVEVEKLVETIKEIEKEVYITDDTEIKELLLKIQHLESIPPKTIEKEIIIEKPVEVIKEVEVEKIVEVVKEVVTEKIVEVTKEVENKEKQKKLQKTLQTLREEMIKKDKNILQLEKNVLELQKIKGPIKAQYMGSSNLNDNLYK